MFKNYFNLKNLDKNFHHGFFTSMGGMSKGNYSSLNCNLSSEDNLNNIKGNIKLALKNLGIPNKKLKIINQVHSNKIFFINQKNFNNKFYGDGLITKEKDIALGVLTADCAPIFIKDTHNNYICCLHSGWKGALNNIAGKSIRILKNKNTKKKKIIAIIGPCLGFKNFEVDKEFKFQFIKKNNSYLRFFKYKNKHKDLFNLRGLIAFQLKKEGIKKIYDVNRDTYKNSRIFFSYRRLTHQNKINTARMINIISLKD